MENQSKIESNSDFANTPAGMAQRWDTEITASKKELKKWHDDAIKITRRYLDRRDDFGRDESRVNLFWSSMKVLLSLLYARPPKASVARSFLDADDDQARVAGVIMERLLNRSFDDNISNWDTTIRQGIEDWLIVGMGQGWLRYEVETQEEPMPPTIDPMTGIEIDTGETFERITKEEAPLDYIYWQDFFYSPARTWDEVRWVARRVSMTRDQLIERFGEEIGRSVALSSQSGTSDMRMNNEEPKYDPWSKAEVFEIWCKETRHVYWLGKGSDVILDYKEDPLQLDGFFPCPKPLAANLTSSNFLPRPDYIFAQDQFNELDEINTRITWLTRATKVVGVYDRNSDGIQRMFSQAAENQLIPVDNWAMFSEAGGVKGKVDWVPIDQVVNAIGHLRQYRADKAQQIYEVLGISDIMRGSSKASETATAQQIKAQFGSTRVQLSQFYIAEWITSLLRIKAEIISKHFQPETIAIRSNIMRTADARYAEEAIALIKDENLSEYRVNVEADSMAAMDWSAERDSATQFLSGLGAFVSQVAPLGQMMPQAVPYMLKLLQWSVSKFRVSADIEGVLDQAIEQMQEAGQQPQQPNPMQVAEVENKKAQAAERQAGAVERQANAQETNVDTQSKVLQLNALARQSVDTNPDLPPIIG